MEKKNEPKLYHIEEMEEYLNSILPDSSNSFKYLYLKKQIMAHFSLARNGYTNRISSYTEAKREALVGSFVAANNPWNFCYIRSYHRVRNPYPKYPIPAGTFHKTKLLSVRLPLLLLPYISEA